MLDLLPPPEQIQALALRFGERKIDDQVDVNYRALISAMEAIERGDSTPRSAPGPDEYRNQLARTGLIPDKSPIIRSSLATETAPEGLESVMREIGRQLCARQTDIKPFLLRIDTKRRGEVSRYRFRAAFTNAGLNLNEREFRLLEEEYTGDVDAHFVHWKRFIGVLDGFMNEMLERPSSPDHSPTQAQVRVRRDHKGNLLLKWSENGSVEFESEGLELLIKHIGSHFIRNRIHITPFFHDYDRCHNNKVSLQQFISVLVGVGVPISPKQKELLVEAFGADGGHHVGTLINYENFTSVVRSTNKRERIQILQSGSQKPQTPMIVNLSL